jgi:hypothetical protein
VCRRLQDVPSRVGWCARVHAHQWLARLFILLSMSLVSGISLSGCQGQGHRRTAGGCRPETKLDRAFAMLQRAFDSIIECNAHRM